MIIYRNYRRSEKDDWILNIQENLDSLTEAIPIIHPVDLSIIGWKIQYRYE